MTVEALRRGEPQVLAELLAQYGREIQGVAYLIVRNRAEAEDVLMDTLLSALDRGSSLRDADAMRQWLLKIATKAQIDPATNRVIARIGSPQASGGVHAGEGQLWITGHFEEPDGWHAVLYRIPLTDD